MIPYHKTAFGIGTLFRIQGSAAYRATLSGFIGAVVFAIVRTQWDGGSDPENNDEIRHPYAVGILVTALTFLLVFRAQAAYARYWEACSAVHHMMSKWMDAITHTAIYHLQCDHYDHIKPPVFYDYPELNQHFLSRAREDRHVMEDTDSYFDANRISQRATKKSIEPVKEVLPNLPHSIALTRNAAAAKRRHKRNGSGGESDFSERSARSGLRSDDLIPLPLEGDPKLDGGWGGLFDDGKATYFDPKNPFQKNIQGGFASTQGGRTPPLFLQELAHLCSLLCGVALATLRNDIEGSESPLDIYKPGADWPEVDPVKLHGDNAFEWSHFAKFLNFLGMGRSAEDRTRYNASRPMPVIGGVSEGEIRFLQMARGPYAKTQLCWQWLSEFVIREHLAGSTGKVGPPIISRIIQFLGDGMIYYNHARKIMFIPFPFPHAQLSAIYILVAIPAVAFVMDQYTEEAWVGACLTFLTVTCLSGIHEVARELENPFRNVPNEIPLVTLQAQFNEALITMYAGYHPDHFWKESGDYHKNMPRRSSPSSPKDPQTTASTPQTDPSTPRRKTSGRQDSPPPPTTATTSANGFDIRPPEIEISFQQQQQQEPIETTTTTPGQSTSGASASLEAQVQMLVQKIEAQGRELEQLRMRAGEYGDEKKVHG